MSEFTKNAAQGDVYFTRVDAIPDGFYPVKSETGSHVVAHSETGHHHVMPAEDVDMFTSANDNFTVYLRVKKKTEIKHLRSFHTHAPITFSPGIYRVKRQREYIPEGFRKAQD